VCGELLTDSARAVVVDSAWGSVRFLACPVCRSWCQRPRIAPQSLSAWYDSEHYQGSPGVAGSAYVDYVGDEAERVAEARRRYRRDLAPYLPPGRARVLEVGCATGSLLSVLRDAGHDVTGIDLSPRFAAVARQRYGLDVIVADVLSADVPGDRFDLVVLLGTASNLPDVSATLRRLRGLLRSPGTLVFNYPAADSLMARIYGRKFWMFAPSVSSFMTQRGCRSALEQAGFTIIRTATDRQMPSTRKLLKHSKLTSLLPVFRAFRLEHRALPLPVPVPGVRVVWARPTDRVVS